VKLQVIAATKWSYLAPRELIHEHYRLRRRARNLTGPVDACAASSPSGPGHVQDAFLDWHATRHGEGPAAAAEAVGTIVSEWDRMTIWMSARSTPARRTVSRWRRT
jgi:hypothetical protein